MDTFRKMSAKTDIFRPIPQAVSAQIDSLRGLSALVVLFAHCNQVIIAPSYHGLYAIFGIIAQSAVMVFFVLSGFLIGKSLTRNASSANGFNIERYARDRANRIFPPLFYATCVMLILFFIAPYLFPTGSNEFIQSGSFMVRSGFHLDAASTIGSLVFANGFITHNISSNAPLWSLSFEVWYYAAAGVIFLCRGWKLLLILMPALLLLGAMNKIFLLYAVVWFAGLAVCILHNNKMYSKNICRVVFLVFGALASSLAAYHIYSFFGYSSPKQISSKIIVLYNILFGISVSAAFLMLVNGSISFKPILKETSSFSYTLYVSHFPIILFAYGATQTLTMNSTLNSFVVTLISAAICIVLSKYAAQYVEAARPFDILKSKLSTAPKKIS